MNSLATLFKIPKPVIGCIHLKALPGAPLYQGKMRSIIEQALSESEIYQAQGVDGIIIENFGDKPFYPGALGAETIAAFTAVGLEIMRQVKVPVGINALRNDAIGALGIATAIEAAFIRVNVHMHAVVCDQGIVTGKAYETLRLKNALKSSVQIWADVNVKHATPLAQISLTQETEDLCQRGLVDSVIVSGEATGKATDLQELQIVKKASSAPVIIGSGMSLDNVESLMSYADGFIVGSYFKKDGIVTNHLDPQRISDFMKVIRLHRNA